MSLFLTVAYPIYVLNRNKLRTRQDTNAFFWATVVLGAVPLVAITLSVMSAMAWAQAYPSRSVTIIVPWPPGGPSDIAARPMAKGLQDELGKPFVIDNRGGAGGNIAGAAAAKAAPDGYTLFFGSTGPTATNTLMYKSLTFDPRRDFTPIVLVGKTPVIIVARPDAPVGSLKELIAYTKANPGKLTAGFPGNGTLGHITGVLLGQQAGVDVKHVQYRGGGAIINDLLGGHIDIAMDAMTPYVPQVQDGKLRALAIAGAGRSKQMPDVPTVAEQGLPGFEASVWYCLLAPTGVAGEVVAKLNAATNAYLKTAQSQELFEKLGIIAAGGTPADLKAFVDLEIEKWGPVVRSAKIEF
jgi:tripartite-type tricarboxylate transporter receptor subunit TctC